MNLPNKLTVFRMILVPVCVLFLLTPGMPYPFLIASIIFCIASLTDLLDGKIARKYNLITSFGKFMDPLADKLLVIGVLTAFVELNLCSAWIVIITLAREFAVTSLRLVAAEKGTVLAANIFGKIKTVTQMASILLIFLFQALFEFHAIASAPWMAILCQACLWVGAAAAVISGVIYFVENRKKIEFTL